MQSEAFREPVTVYLKDPDGVVRPTRICTTEEAYKALTSGEQIPVGKAEWHVARHNCSSLTRPRTGTGRSGA